MFELVDLTGGDVHRTSQAGGTIFFAPVQGRGEGITAVLTVRFDSRQNGITVRKRITGLVEGSSFLPALYKSVMYICSKVSLNSSGLCHAMYEA